MRAAPRSITEPLSFKSYIRAVPKLGWGLFALVDLMIILAMLFLNYSRFVSGAGRRRGVGDCRFWRVANGE